MLDEGARDAGRLHEGVELVELVGAQPAEPAGVIGRDGFQVHHVMLLLLRVSSGRCGHPDDVEGSR